MRNLLIFSSSFINGAIIMIIEVLAIKKLEPHFGNSLILWSAVIGCTMLGLVFGYLIGGKINTKNKKSILLIANFISIILILGIIYMLDNFIHSFNYSNYKSMIMITCFVMLTPLLLTMGIISPILAELTTLKNENSGEKAGLVFTYSSLGGIFSILIFGLYVIPQFGVNFSYFFTISLICIESTLITFIKK